MAARRASRKRTTRKARKATRRVSRKRRASRKKVVRRRRKARKSVVGSKRQVFNGTRERTSGYLKKANVFKNKRGKIVSKKANAHGKRMYKRGLQKWTTAFMKARKPLNVKGFKPCKKGTALYKKTMEFYKA